MLLFFRPLLQLLSVASSLLVIVEEVERSRLGRVSILVNPVEVVALLKYWKSLGPQTHICRPGIDTLKIVVSISRRKVCRQECIMQGSKGQDTWCLSVIAAKGQLQI